MTKLDNEPDAAKPVNLPKGDFFRGVGDIRMHYNVTGEGPLLIHQTGMWLLDWRKIAEPVTRALAQYFTVLTMDARGQGRTSLGNGAITYARLAADTAGLMDALSIDRAHFFGGTGGGCALLEMALNYPEKVKSCSIYGAANDHDAYRPEMQGVFNAWQSEMTRDSDTFLDERGIARPKEMIETFRTMYAEVSPQPDRFTEVIRQQRRSWSTEPDISLRRLTAIDRPVMLLTTNEDEVISLESMREMATAIPRSTMVSIEGMTHSAIPKMNEVSLAVSKFVESVEARYRKA